VGSESLKDEAVALRPWSFTDVDAIVECIDGDPEIARWLDQVPQPYTRKDARGYVGGIGEQAFAIVDSESGRLLGSIGVRWNERRDVGEIGYWVRADARGRGVVTRALRLV
jgi:RimJ/RimL family protein N-acetyltransferase